MYAREKYYQQAGKKDFKLGTKQVEFDDVESTEEMVDQVVKQRVQDDVDKRGLLFNKRGLRGLTSSVCMCLKKEVSIGQHRRRSSLGYLLCEMSMLWYFSEVPTHQYMEIGWGGELEVCMQLQGYDLTGITET